LRIHQAQVAHGDIVFTNTPKSFLQISY